MREYAVPLGEMLVSSSPQDSLKVNGVSSNIIFLVRGYYYDDENSRVRFIGIFNWSGFETQLQSNNPKQAAVKQLYDFFDKLRSKLNVDTDMGLFINKLSFIGGEKMQCSPTGELLLSGTEAEVRALETEVAGFDFDDEWLFLQPNAIEHHHYITSHNQTLEVFLSADRLHYLIEGAIDSNLGGIDFTSVRGAPDSDSESDSEYKMLVVEPYVSSSSSYR